MSLVYDDIVLENPILKGFPVFDIGQVEVLRGPQGTLFGRNTPAGVVKFDSKKPTDEPDGYVDFSYANLNTAKVRRRDRRRTRAILVGTCLILGRASRRLGQQHRTRPA